FFHFNCYHKIICTASRRQLSNKFVRNEFEQPLAAFGEGQGCPSLIPRSIVHYVTGMSEGSQQRGSAKDEVRKG
ncbi:hypothetical protein, partial [Salmonella enterica]|uniref:hypothetical protein n=1 Tax=Salmonella enterica TaxID=28901 RepID=UPI001C387F11